MEPSQVNLRASNFTAALPPSTAISGILRAKVPKDVPSFGATLLVVLIAETIVESRRGTRQAAERQA